MGILYQTLSAILVLALLSAASDVDIDSEEEKVFAPSDDGSVRIKEGEGVRDYPTTKDATDLWTTLPNHINSTILFVKPFKTLEPLDMPTNTLVKLLISLHNEATSPSDIYVERTDASLRYPQDTMFFIQNFTSKRYYPKSKTPYHLLGLKDFSYLGCGKRAVYEYAFKASEQLAGRPFTLVINAIYRDANSTQYEKAVFNQTLMFTELETGLDGQTFFLYLLMAGCVVLLILFLQNFLSSWGKKKLNQATASVTHSVSSHLHNAAASASGAASKGAHGASALTSFELGTQSGLEGVDLEWLPKETIQELSKKLTTTPHSGSTKVTKRHPTTQSTGHKK